MFATRYETKQKWIVYEQTRGSCYLPVRYGNWILFYAFNNHTY